ncbi:MAG: hypothetical protein IH968_14060 [Gemmatimonadetes bacterium]|nr:hypothetical protein [Gemmatimonadota bacterium]
MEPLAGARDIAFLDQQDVSYEVAVESGLTCVVLKQWPLPTGFDHETADLLIRLNPGYPDVQPDMWFMLPDNNVMDLTQYDWGDTGQLLEFDLELEDGFIDIEIG